ncbi:MAG: hypothetical protein LBH51_08920 [Treponema sp.]|nr:hypothetical protein [Treponema sp.]
MKKIIALFVVLLCFAGVLSAEEKRMAPLGFPSAAGNGMGGSHVAYTSDMYALFVNPAALQWANQGSVVELSSALIGPLNKFVKNGILLSDMLKNMENSFGGNSRSNPFGPILDIIKGGKLPLGIDLRGPVSAAYTANGLGFGLFSRISANARVIGTDVDGAVYGDFMLPFGMSFNILKTGDHELAGGFVLKPFIRIMGDINLSALSLVNNSNLLEDIPASMIGGLGSDLGLLYRFRQNLAAGFTVADLYTAGGKMSDINGTSPNSIYRVPLSLNFGAAYTFRPADLWQGMGMLNSSYAAFTVDWHGLNNVFTWNDRIHRNPILDLGLGAEIGLFDFLKLRVGLRDMLPMMGLGLESRAVKFNIALFGKEMGIEPGVNSTMALDMSIAFRLDTQKREWSWSKALLN